MEGKNSQPDSIGLCLSGGGFRASLFHLGVLRYLAESNQLSNVRVISTVSGGSIIGAFLSTRWNRLKEKGFSYKAFIEEVYDPFIKHVTTSNLRNRWLVLCIPNAPRLLTFRYTFINLWSGFFDRWFFGGKKLKVNELPENLNLVINATELKFGKAYRFSPTFYGSDDEGYDDYNGNNPVRLADVVTSSAAHLPLNLSIKARERQWFIDGGAFDNTGLDWFLDWEDKERPKTAIKPDFLIVCEASKELPSWSWGWRRIIPLYRMFQVLDRWKGIQYEQSRRIRKDWFIDRIQKSNTNGKVIENPTEDESKKENGIIISIDVVGGKLKEAEERGDYKKLVDFTVPEDLVKGKNKNPGIEDIRTDLDNFLKEEAELLTYHGYSLTHVYLTTFHEFTEIKGHRLAVEDPEWKIEFTDKEIDRYLRALIKCNKRLTFKRRLL